MIENEEEIAALLQQFYKQTRSLNSLSGIEHTPSAVAMIAIGKPVAHYIFQHNISLSFKLMELLKHVTGYAPTPATLGEMREDWLNWAAENNYR